MANLTWRDVAAPDFSTAMNGYRQFSGMIGDALDGLGAGLTKFDNVKSEEVNKQFALMLAQQQDPETLQAQIASGQLTANVDPRRLSAENIAALSNRPGQLIEQASNKVDLAQKSYGFDRSKTENAAMDAARPAVAELAIAAATGDPAAIAAVRTKHAAVFGNMPTEKILSTLSGVQGLENGQVNLTGNRLGNEQKAWDLGNAKDAHADEERALTVFQGIRDSSSTAEDARLQLFDPKGPAAGLSPRARASLDRRLSEQFPGVFGSPDAAGGGGISLSPGVGGAGISSSVLGLTYGGGTLPDSIQTIGDVVKNKKALVNQLGASPVGVFQINADTWADFAPRVLGSGWEGKAVRDFQTQDSVAKAIFESTGGDYKRLMGRWASLSEAQAKAIAGKPWAEARDVIAKGESGISTAELMQRNNATQVTNAIDAMKIGNPGIAQDLLKTIGDSSTAPAVADKLLAGDFKGTSRQILVSKIDEIMSKADVNAATAGAILSRSVEGSDAGLLNAPKRWGRRFAGGSPNLGGGIRLDDDKLNQNIQEVKGLNPTIAGQVDALQRLQNTQGQLQQANAILNQATINYQRASQQAVTNPRLVPALTRHQAEVAAAKATVDALTRDISLIRAEAEARRRDAEAATSKSKPSAQVRGPGINAGFGL